MAESQTQVDEQCQLPVSSGMKLTLKSLRNDKGNWVTKERGGARGRMDAMRTEPWSVDVECDTRTCEGAESSLHVSLTITAPLPKLGPGYELFPGIGHYKFHHNPLTWANARQTCAEEGAHLMIVNSEKEADVIKTLNARHPTIAGASDNSWMWVGVERKDGNYVTVFGDALDTTGFTRWDPGKPNKQAADNCILVHRVSGGLGDVRCDWVVAFTCERELQ